MAMSVSDLEEGLDVVSDQVDEIDEDLSDLEGYVYEDDDDCCCGDDDCYEIECPNCGETICVDDGILEDGSIDCPTAALCSSSISMTIAAAAMTTATAITTTDKNQKSNAAACRSCGAQFCFIRRKFAAALFISAAPTAQTSEKLRRVTSAKRRR